MDISPRAFSACETGGARPTCVRQTSAFCPSRCRERCDAWPAGALSPFFDRLAVWLGIISAVSLNAIWPKARSTAFSFDMRNLVEQGEQLGNIVTVRLGKNNG